MIGRAKKRNSTHCEFQYHIFRETRVFLNGGNGGDPFPSRGLYNGVATHSLQILQARSIYLENGDSSLRNKTSASFPAKSPAAPNRERQCRAQNFGRRGNNNNSEAVLISRTRQPRYCSRNYASKIHLPPALTNFRQTRFPRFRKYLHGSAAVTPASRRSTLAPPPPRPSPPKSALAKNFAGLRFSRADPVKNSAPSAREIPLGNSVDSSERGSRP